MELKLYYRFIERRFYEYFNRTNMELKLRDLTNFQLLKIHFNRTNMELKLSYVI